MKYGVRFAVAVDYITTRFFQKVATSTPDKTSVSPSSHVCQEVLKHMRGYRANETLFPLTFARLPGQAQGVL